MSTLKQKIANRRNARKSTGPRSPEGKTIVSANAYKHGVYSQQRIAPGENVEDYNYLRDSYTNHALPTDPFEQTLIDQMTDAEWRRRRYNRCEAGLFWYRHNVAQTSSNSLAPCTPENEDERTTHRYGRAIQDLTGEPDNLSALARFETGTRRAFIEAYQTLVMKRRMEMQQINNSLAEETTIDVAGEPESLPPASETLTSEKPRAENKANFAVLPKESEV